MSIITVCGGSETDKIRNYSGWLALMHILHSFTVYYTLEGQELNGGRESARENTVRGLR